MKMKFNRFPATWRDLAVVAALVAAYFLAASQWNFAERIAQIGRAYEPEQLDELPMTLLVLSLGMCWFAFRRAAEARRAEVRNADLLGANRDLSQRLIVLQESERQALARELHDEFGQNCAAIRAEASYILRADAGEREAIAASAARIAGTAEDLYEMVKGMLVRLRPPALDSLGLESAVQELCEAWEEQTGIACGFFPRDVSFAIDDSASVAVFRLVQEALTNVARHADASQVRIEMHATPDRRILHLNIRDDGHGMPANVDSRRGFGLIGMRERVTALDGEIRFHNLPRSGLCIEVEMPLKMSGA
jgi:glucose-6-phosphate-specific signal transduction histidine kinase